MRIVQGTSLVKRNAIGTLHFLHRDFPEPPRSARGKAEQEWERFLTAQARGVLELTGLYDRAAAEVDEGTAAIFAIHAMLLEDEDLTQMVYELIEKQGTSAEYAVWKTATDVVSSFRAMENPYMKARGADILDIANRVIHILKGEALETVPDRPTILAADYFLPSEVVGRDPCRRLQGVISRKGTPDSHTALLLQAYQIPAIVETELGPDWEGHRVLLNGYTGEVCMDPDEEMERELLQGTSAELT